MFIYLYLRERENAQAGEGQRERWRRNQKQALGSELSAQEPDVGLEPIDCEIMT